ncbi:MAG: hypothetical protein WBA74_04705 [Cyclobacteriaceae bacterium]
MIDNSAPSKARIYLQRTLPMKAFIHPATILIVMIIVMIPARVVEVVIRKNFGERYYSLKAGLLPVVVLILYPLGLYQAYKSGNTEVQMDWFYILFLLAYIGCAIKRKMEISYELHSFDDSKYSYYAGDQLSLWKKYALKIPRVFPKESFSYNVERAYEGGLFIAVGIVFVLVSFSRIVGGVMVVCGIMYIIHAYNRYKLSRYMILDKIDEKILNGYLYDAFINGEEKHGLRWSGPTLSDPAFNEEIAHSLTDVAEDDTSGFVT